MNDLSIVPETPGIWLPGGEYKYFDDRFAWIRANMSDRVARLFAVAVARTVLHHIPASDSRPCHACDVAERYADGLATDAELASAYAASAYAAYASASASASAYASAYAAYAYASAYAASASAYAAYAYASASASVYARSEQSRRLTLYMPRPWNARWNTDATRQLAEIIYTERAYDRVPILADALLDAYCDDEEILTWLRKLPVETWRRGTWILDILTGRR